MIGAAINASSRKTRRERDKRGLGTRRWGRFQVSPVRQGIPLAGTPQPPSGELSPNQITALWSQPRKEDRCGNPTTSGWA